MNTAKVILLFSIISSAALQAANITSGMVSFYPFPGNSEDQSGNNNHCRNYGASLTTDRFGNENNAQSFDGVSTYMQCYVGDSTFQNDWTISAWIYRRTNTQCAGIVSNNVNIFPAPILTMDGRADNNRIWVMLPSINWEGLYIDIGLDHYLKWIFVTLTKWGASSYQISAISFSNSNNYTFNKKDVSWSTAIFTSHQIQIGRHNGIGSCEIFDGKIDDVRIHSRTLTIEEIWDLYCYPYKSQKIQEPDVYGCLTNCSDGFLKMNGSCIKCSNSCKTCNQTAAHCTSCDLNFGLQHSDCLSECPSGFVNNNSICMRIEAELLFWNDFSKEQSDLLGNECTYFGGSKTADRLSIQNNAQSFDGIKSYIQCVIPNHTFQQNWTITAWFYHRYITPTACIISNFLFVTEATWLGFYPNPNQLGMPWIGVADGPAWIGLGYDHLNKWYFVSLRYDGNYLSLLAKEFKNGSNLASWNGPLSYTLKQSSSIFIGSSPQDIRPINFFDGSISSLRIQDQKLTDDQLQALYCQPRQQSKGDPKFCADNCGLGFYANSSGGCNQCDNSCKTCNITSNYCTSCTEGQGLFNGKCQNSCDYGYSIKNSTCTPDIAGMVAFYSFENSIISQNADCLNQEATPTADRFGNENSAYFFNGRSSFIRCPIDSGTFKDNWTIAAWIYHRSMTSGSGIVSNNVEGHNSAILTMKEFGNFIGMCQEGYSWDNGVYVDLGKDHFNKWIFAMVMRVNNSIQVISKDFSGSLSLSSQWEINQPLNSSKQIQIGKHFNTLISNLFDGIIDDVRIFNREISENEIFYLYCYPYPYQKIGNNWQCITECPEGFQMFNGTCNKCDNSCKSCTLSAKQCSSCYDNYVLFKRQCLFSCPIGFSSINSTCSIPGLVSFQGFSENTNDYTSNHNDCKNLQATQTTDRFGNINNAQEFNGKDSYLGCPIDSSTFKNENNWTIAAWI